MKLENLKPGISLAGIEPTLIATVVAVVPIGGGAIQVLYRTPEWIEIVSTVSSAMVYTKLIVPTSCDAW
jgi:hypothetical protein